MEKLLILIRPREGCWVLEKMRTHPTSVFETHPEWANAVVLEKGIPAALSKGTWHGETAFLARDGRVIPVSQVIIAHKDAGGTVNYLSTVARDITELKLFEKRLRKAKRC